MLNIDCAQTDRQISSFIRDELRTSGQHKLVIALSGGIDSAVSCALGVHAVGPENIIAVMLPYGALSEEATRDARQLTAQLRIPNENTKIIDIQPAVDTIVQQIPDINDARRGNIMARMRMIYLYDLAKKYTGLVLGTENKTEYYLGYFTRFGDEASDIEPIRQLYKTQVRQMGEYLQLPQSILTKAPSAGLWSNQTDEKEYGFTYDDADKVLYYYFDEHVPLDEIEGKSGVPREVVARVMEWVRANDFKHHAPRVFGE
ncbi:MAG TPA: NAD+ synthase [Ktedonobacteraceae bacterium]|jgi:NAD+ synthase|nr:NAD+ synthase [Ktedonobacteraceae bacterium]